MVDFTGRERRGGEETVRNINCIASCVCLQRVRASIGRDQTFTENKERRAWDSRCGELKGQRCLKFCESIFYCGQEDVTASAAVEQWAAILSYWPRVGLADKSQGGSGPTAQGVTAEYTWPGSFRPSRDNRKRLLAQPQPKLTKGIMCGGRSKQSEVGSANV